MSFQLHTTTYPLLLSPFSFELSAFSYEVLEQCGWCKDKYGLRWQIVPENMGELMERPNAFANMMVMKKIVIADF